MNLDEKDVVLTDKDMHCIGRVIQSQLFASEEGMFYGCQYCKYVKQCNENFLKDHQLHFKEVRSKIERLTGIDLGYLYNPEMKEEKFKNYETCSYQYMRFSATEQLDELEHSCK